MTQLASRVRTTPIPASLPAGAQLRVATVPQRPEGYARLIGELDLASVEVVRANICRLIASNRDVVVDLAPLSFCDAARGRVKRLRSGPRRASNFDAPPMARPVGAAQPRIRVPNRTPTATAKSDTTVATRSCVPAALASPASSAKPIRPSAPGTSSQ